MPGALETLRLCLCLQDCTISTVPGRLGAPTYQDITLLDDLRSLTLRCGTDVKLLLNGLLCPTLISIDIECDWGDQYRWPKNAFLSLLSRSSCSLERFSLH